MHSIRPGRREPMSATALRDQVDLATYRQMACERAAAALVEKPTHNTWEIDLLGKLAQAEQDRADAYAEYARHNREALANLTDGAA